LYIFGTMFSLEQAVNLGKNLPKVSIWY
jgi:hypothetical protein